jgi:hypothetical protein
MDFVRHRRKMHPMLLHLQQIDLHPGLALAALDAQRRQSRRRDRDAKCSMDPAINQAYIS